MHPYQGLADRQVWARAVATRFDPDTVASVPFPLIKADQKIMSAGSCFAATLVPHIERGGFHYVRTQPRPPGFGGVAAEHLAYATYSAAYGNIYTARHLLQLILRCQGRFQPQEDRWHDAQGVRDPFRPGLRYFARSDREFDLLTGQYLKSVRAALRECDVLIFTLGLTEAWRSKLDGAVFPACPGTIAGSFDESRHEFVNFKVGEIVADLDACVDAIRMINPLVRIILTVSPVPIVATATGRHVLAANSYSKCALRAAAEEATARNEDVYYFPSYEIVAGPQAPRDFFTDDRRHVSATAIELVMSLFFSKCERPARLAFPVEPGGQGARPPTKHATMAGLSDRLLSLECEESGQDN